jgi:hypothetical protein
MYPQRMVRLILRLGLLVTLVVLVLSACGGNKQQESNPRPLPEDRKALHPGKYRSEEFKPSLIFRVGEGWSTLPPEESHNLFIERGETSALVVFLNVQEVIKPNRTGTPYVVDAPKDMVGWFQEHPYLQTDKPEPVTVGGVKGEQFDVVVEDVPEDYSGVCGADCVDLFSSSTGIPVYQSEEEKVRVTVLEDVKGETVTIGFASPITEFDKFAPEAQKVIDTVEWRGS